MSAIITTVKDLGRVHVSYGEEGKRLGNSFSTYNNIFTKLYGMAIGNVQKVQINNKVFYANFESFNKHLQSINLTPLEKKTELITYNKIINNPLIKIDSENVGKWLSKEKRELLLNDLKDYITYNSLEKAKKMIRKGVDLSAEIIDTKHYKDGSGGLYCGYLAIHTPLTWALMNNAKAISHLIYKMKNKQIENDCNVIRKRDRNWHTLQYHSSGKVIEKNGDLLLVKTEL